MLAITTPSLTWAASCAVAAVFLSVVLLITRAALERRNEDVKPATVWLAASLIGGSMSLIALALLSTS